MIWSYCIHWWLCHVASISFRAYRNMEYFDNATKMTNMFIAVGTHKEFNNLLQKGPDVFPANMTWVPFKTSAQLAIKAALEAHHNEKGTA